MGNGERGILYDCLIHSEQWNEALLRTARTEWTHAQACCKVPMVPRSEAYSTRAFQQRMPSDEALSWNGFGFGWVNGLDRRPGGWNKLLATSRLLAQRPGWRRPKQRAITASGRQATAILIFLFSSGCRALSGVSPLFQGLRSISRRRAKMAADAHLVTSGSVAAGDS